MRQTALLALSPVALLLSASAFAEIPQGLETQLDGQIGAALRRVEAPSVSVAVVENGRVAYVRAFGMADLENQRPATVETRYAIGSISKQFTAAALLLLQEQGKLSLDERVSKYFTDLTRANEITIRQLLSHTSGYEDYAPQDYIIPDWTQPISPAAILDRWARKPLNFDPGSKWQYSNTNYVLAGEIFEKVAGQPLVAFLKERIFAPLGMTSAGDWPPDSPGDARAYTRYALGPARLTKREAQGWYFAAGELAMTPSDLAKWDVAFLERRILTPKSWDELTTEVKLSNGDSTHYALGLTLADLNGMPVFQHGGEVSGFISSNSVFPTRGGAVVVLSNEDVVNLVGPLSRQIATTVFLRPKESSIPTAEVSRILLDLQKGRIDRGLLSTNANSYFTPAALRDCRTSLGALGKLKSVSGVSENDRGGMTHRAYIAEFAKKTVQLNVYILPDGKYEQFLVVASS